MNEKEKKVNKKDWWILGLAVGVFLLIVGAFFEAGVVNKQSEAIATLQAQAAELGPQGSKGEPGPAGPQGEPGPPGPTGEGIMALEAYADTVCPVGKAEIQSVNPDEFVNGRGRVYGIAAFGAQYCWYALEGQTLFEGWTNKHEVIIGWGAQELWPWRQGTVRIYPTEGFDPLEEAKSLAVDKCGNVESDEQLKFVPIIWKFHGLWEAEFTCEDVYAGNWPEVPAEMLVAQDDEFPLCYGQPKADPVCGEAETTKSVQTAAGTDSCPEKVTPVSFSQLATYPGCMALLEGSEGSNHGIWVDQVENLPEREGSYWVIPAEWAWDLDGIAGDFFADKCAAVPGLVVNLYWPDGSVDQEVCN